MPNDKIHPSNLLYCAICSLGVIAFFLAAIYPNISALKSMDADISELNKRSETQSLLYPVYLSLLKEILQKMPGDFPVPQDKKISHYDLNRINDLFHRLASENDVVFTSAIPDATNYLDDIGYFSMNVVVKGNLASLRNFILSICRLSYLESIDAMRIESLKAEKQLSLKIKLKQE